MIGVTVYFTPAANRYCLPFLYFLDYFLKATTSLHVTFPISLHPNGKNSRTSAAKLRSSSCRFS